MIFSRSFYIKRIILIKDLIKFTENPKDDRNANNKRNCECLLDREEAEKLYLRLFL